MKKGFTLIELLAVLVILGLLAAIAYPNVNRNVLKYREKVLKKQEANILLAAQLWASDNQELLPSDPSNDTVVTYTEIKSSGIPNSYGVLKITYGDLIKEEYIDPATNPLTKKEIEDDEYYVLIRKSVKKWTYELKSTGEVFPSDINLNASESSVQMGKKITITAIITPDNVTNKKITWTCTESFTISEDGLSITVKGTTIGTHRVIATTSNGKTAAYNFTVTG